MSRCAPRTLAISQRRTEHGDDVVAWARAIAAAGVDAIQLREKDLGVRRLLELARRSIESVPASVMVLVNGRLDVAIASGAAGAHLPANGLPLARARRRWPDLVLGVSTHRRDEVAAARDAGADYVVFGPVFAPISKDSRAGAGGRRGAGAGVVARRRRCSRSAASPSSGSPEIAAAGAAGVAAIGAFQPPHDAAAFVAAAHRLFPSSPARSAARSEAMAP